MLPNDSVRATGSLCVFIDVPEMENICLKPSPYLVTLVSWVRAEAAVDQIHTVLPLGLIGLKIGIMEADIPVELVTASTHLGTFILSVFYLSDNYCVSSEGPILLCPSPVDELQKFGS
jgi:hypothetical protein